MLHSDKYYMGVSVPQLLNRNFADNNDPVAAFNPRLVRHLYIAGGYVINTNSALALKPNFLVKAVENAPVEVDLNLNVLVAKILWLGVSMRSELSQSEEKQSGILESISGLIGLQVTPRWLFGYAYDFTTTSLDANSHEIILNYIIPRQGKKILTPRYF